MANPNLMHEGNEGCFRIHRNAGKFELKFEKNKKFTILVKSEDLSLLADLRSALYYHYDHEMVYPHDVDKSEVKRVAERLWSKMTKGELEKVMDERVERHKEESPIASKIVIKKEKEKYPVPGDFIILYENVHEYLGIVAEVNETYYFVFIETGGSILMDDISSKWRFATATVEAM